MRTGIYGGTFSPPHNGHVSAAKAFVPQLGLDELLVIPAGIPPHKRLDYADDPERRLELCRIAFGGINKVVVSDIELRRDGKSYTVETLRELEGEGRELFLLCGTDMILTLDRWYMADEIFARCTPVYMRRENDPDITEKIKAKLGEYKEKYGVDVRAITFDVNELSSSEVREAVKRGEDISSLVPPGVAEYIKEKQMYL